LIAKEDKAINLVIEKQRDSKLNIIAFDNF